MKRAGFGTTFWATLCLALGGVIALNGSMALFLVISGLALGVLGIGLTIKSPHSWGTILASASLLFLIILGITIGFQEDETRIASDFHLLGVDVLGRDVWMRLRLANRSSMLHAGLSIGLTLIFALLYGAILTFSPKPIQKMAHTLLQVFLAFPVLLGFLLLATLADPLFHEWPTFTRAGFAALVLWAEPAKLFHLRLEELKHAEFIQAATLAGFSGFETALRNYIPNLIQLAAVNAMMVAIQAIVLEALLGFLGFAHVPGTPHLGHMIYSGMQAPNQDPHVYGLALAILLIWVFAIHHLISILKEKGSRPSPIIIYRPGSKSVPDRDEAGFRHAR